MRARVALAVVAVAWIAAVHLALAWIEHRPAPRRMFGDEYTYLRWAEELRADGEWRPEPPLWPPLYPRVLAPLLAAGGRGAVAIAQFALLVAAALALRGIGRALTGPGPAPDLAAAALLGFPPLAAYVHYLWPEVLHLALFLFAAWVLAGGRRGAGWLIALGLALGLAAAAKHLLGPLLPLLVLPLVFEGGRAGLRRGLARAALAAAACAAVLVPVAAADLARHGEPTARAASIFNLWVGLEEHARPDAVDWIAEDAYRRYRASAPDQRGRREFVERELARRLGERGLPARLASRLGRQYARLLDREGMLTGQLPGGALHAGGVGYRDPPAWLAAALRGSSHALWALALVLAPLGVVLAPPRAGRRWRWLPLGFVAYNLGLFAVLHVDARFRVQLLPFLLLWAAIGAVWVARRLVRPGVEPSPRPAAVAAALAASALLLVLAFGGGGAGDAAGAGAPRVAGEPPINVLLVTLDAVRTDRLSSFGDPRPDILALDRLAARGTRFANAFAPSPRRVPALASMFTGRYPSFHSVGVSGEASLTPEMVTLAEILTGAGYHAAAVVVGPSLARRLDLDQGFSAYDVTASDDRPEGHTAAAVAEARALLVETGEPWFLWLHPGDPHGAAGPPSGEPGRWLDELAAAGRLERTLLIVTAIPRESLEDAAVPSAGRDSLALDRVRVPLLLAGPGVSAGAVIEPPVSTAAVFATVLDAAGLALPADLPRPRPAPSLLPLAARRRSSAPPAFVESATEIGVARGDAYLFRERTGGDARRPRFRELIPLAGSRVPIAVERDLDAVLDAFERRAAAAASRPATP